MTATLTRTAPVTQALCSGFGQVELDEAPRTVTTSVPAGIRKRRSLTGPLERQLLRRQATLRRRLGAIAARVRAGESQEGDLAEGKRLARLELRLRAGLGGLCLLREELARLRRAWWRREQSANDGDRYATLAHLYRVELNRLVGEVAAAGAAIPSPWGTRSPEVAREGRRLLRVKIRWGLATCLDFMTYFDLGRSLVPAPAPRRASKRAA